MKTTIKNSLIVGKSSVMGIPISTESHQSKGTSMNEEPEDVVAYHADGSRTVRIKLKREWVGLTDEDMQEPRTHIFDFIDGARWAEAKLKEKTHDRRR